MTTLHAPLVAFWLGLAALPAAAVGIPLDLPRLDFPAPGTDTSRDCTLPLLPGAPHPCPGSGN